MRKRREVSHEPLQISQGKAPSSQGRQAGRAEESREGEGGMTLETFLNGKVTLHAGDSRDVLKTIADNSIDSIVTDPPYALVSIVKRFGGANAAPAKGNDAYTRASRGFMGKTWDTGEVAFSEEFWAEVLRVLKPGGHVAAFGASRGYHRMACAIEDAGFEIRDSLMWVYGTGFPKSHDVSKGIDKAAGARGHDSKGFNAAGLGAGYLSNGGSKFRSDHPDYVKPQAVTPAAAEWEGWGTALKPAFEPIVLARKPLSEGTVAANVLRWGTGALNIDGCRVGEGVLRSTGNGRRDRSDGWGMQGGAIGGSELGRWPANVVHDGSDEVVGAFPSARSGGHVNTSERGVDRSEVYGKFKTSRAIPGVNTYSDSGSAARFFYSAKASKADRNGSKHPTVKPIALMEWLATLITPPGGTVLDPFAGSGTTGEAAFREGFNAVLIEREPEYQADIRRRMALCMSGPDERNRESIKAKIGKVPFEPGSLFAGMEAAE